MKILMTTLLCFFTHSSFAISPADTCDTERFAKDYKSVAKDYKSAKDKFISIATKLSCYPKGQGKCQHAKLVQPTADFQKAVSGLNMRYDMASSEYGNCYPELIGIDDSPFIKKDYGLE